MQEARAVARSQEASYIALNHKNLTKSTAQTPKFSPTYGPRPLNPYNAAVKQSSPDSNQSGLLPLPSRVTPLNPKQVSSARASRTLTRSG